MEKGKGVVWDVAEEVYIGFDAPVVVVGLKRRVLVEEAAVPAAHVAVREHPAFAYAESAQVVEAVHVASLVDPGWRGPVGERNEVVGGGCRSDIRGGGDEVGGEWLLAEEEPRVVVPAIEAELEFPHAL